MKLWKRTRQRRVRNHEPTILPPVQARLRCPLVQHRQLGAAPRPRVLLQQAPTPRQLLLAQPVRLQPLSHCGCIQASEQVQSPPRLRSRRLSRHILRAADGVDTEQTIGRAVAVTVGDLTIPVISLQDLIANKRASGRPQDLADVALLERAAQRL